MIFRPPKVVIAISSLYEGGFQLIFPYRINYFLIEAFAGTKKDSLVSSAILLVPW